MSPILLLPLLLYMDFDGFNTCEYKINYCFATKLGINHLGFNRVYHTGPISDQDITCIKQYFDTTPFTWPVERKDVTTTLLLKKHNLIQYHIPFAGMLADLTIIPNNAYKKDISIKQIAADDLGIWLSIVSQSFGNTYPLAELTKGINILLTKKYDSIAFYVGYYKDIPACASMLIYHENIVTLHMIGTLPDYRNKGLGYAVTHKPLEDAAKKGCQYAALMASIMGKSLYEDLGFKEYALYDVYMYKP